MDIVLAIVLGALFGFVLQRIGAADPDKIIGMLRLSDLQLMKTILTAIGLASSLLFVGLALGWVVSSHLSVKNLYTGVLMGGALLGVGWALAGFCPGTAVVAAGAGRKDALFFIAGGLCGAGLFMVNYQSLVQTVLFETLLGGAVTLADTGKYQSLLNGVEGLWPALLVSVVFIVVARALPGAFRG